MNNSQNGITRTSLWQGPSLTAGEEGDVPHCDWILVEEHKSFSEPSDKIPRKQAGHEGRPSAPTTN